MLYCIKRQEKGAGLRKHLSSVNQTKLFHFFSGRNIFQIKKKIAQIYLKIIGSFIHNFKLSMYE